MRKKAVILFILLGFAVAFVGSVIMFSNKNMDTFEEGKAFYKNQKEFTVNGRLVDTYKASGPIHLLQISPVDFSQTPLQGVKNTIGLRTVDSSYIFLLAKRPDPEASIDSVSVQNFQVTYFSQTRKYGSTPVEQLRKITMEATKREVEQITGNKLVWLDEN